jgi:hypothetical protein
VLATAQITELLDSIADEILAAADASQSAGVAATPPEPKALDEVKSDPAPAVKADVNASSPLSPSVSRLPKVSPPARAGDPLSRTMRGLAAPAARADAIAISTTGAGLTKEYPALPAKADAFEPLARTLPGLARNAPPKVTDTDLVAVLDARGLTNDWPALSAKTEAVASVERDEVAKDSAPRAAKAAALPPLTQTLRGGIMKDRPKPIFDASDDVPATLGSHTAVPSDAPAFATPPPEQSASVDVVIDDSKPGSTSASSVDPALASARAAESTVQVERVRAHHRRSSLILGVFAILTPVVWLAVVAVLGYVSPPPVGDRSARLHTPDWTKSPLAIEERSHQPLAVRSATAASGRHVRSTPRRPSRRPR